MRLVILLALAGCTGGVVGSPSEPRFEVGPGPGQPVDPAVLAEPASLGPSAVRRLTRTEYRDTLAALTGEAPTEAELASLPDDSVTPFDNDFTDQAPSAALVEATYAIAGAVTERVFAAAARRDSLVGCAPSGPGDETCLRSFIGAFGRSALRRPLEAVEVDELAAFSAAAIEAEDFYVAAAMVVRALLADMELLYRVEVGTPVDGDLVALGPYELASRLAFTFWGAGPDDALLDAAAAGDLDEPEEIRTAATGMLRDPRAAGRFARLHAMWLGYDTLPHPPALAAALRRESDALVESVVFGGKSWLDIFRAEETFIDDTLAAHYGLPETGAGPGWRPYGNSGRRGLLSHGAVLANGAKLGDTSLVQRGIFVRTRLACETIPPPPPNAGVNVDEPPQAGPGECKADVAVQHRAGGCAACHGLIDPVGLGLEQFDSAGRFRTHEPEKPFCAISGEGLFSPLGSFNGPSELADRLLEAERLDTCFVDRLVSFTAGRPRLGNGRTEERMLAWWRAAEHDTEALLVEIAASPGFRHRVVAATEQRWP